MNLQNCVRLILNKLTNSELGSEYSGIKNFISNYNEFTLFEYVFGFFLILLFIIILGMVISNIVGKKLFVFFENILLSIPVVNKVYTIIKQIINTITKQDEIAFQKVALIEYPRKGIYAMCFITGETQDKKFYNLFIPTTPIPTSGYLLFIPKNDVQILDDISIEDAMKIIISGGMVSPENFTFKDESKFYQSSKIKLKKNDD